MQVGSANSAMRRRLGHDTVLFRLERKVVPLEVRDQDRLLTESLE